MRTSARQACSVASVLLGFAALGSTALADPERNISRPPTVSNAATKAKDAPSSAVAALAAARAAEKVADTNLSAALEADEKADAAHESAAAMAKANPTPANQARAREAAAADEEADTRLTEALLADRVADDNLKAAEKAFMAEKNSRGSATRTPGVIARPTVPLALARE